MKISNRFGPSAPRRPRGFSLLEVLIAVVVLSTGFLALAALQGSLARASADAKIRTQVAAMMQARMDQLRAIGYFSADDATDSCAANAGATDGSDFVTAAFCTQNALSAFTLVQEVDTWTSAVGANSFAVGAPADVNDPQFKRVVLRAQWTDATGASRQMAMSSDLSELSLKDSLVEPPDDESLDTMAPLVRQDNPATAGVIPIALGDGSASAASNPTPELVGRNNNVEIVGTKFNVLTYAPSGGGFQIQRRFENQVVKCSCTYGAGGNNLPEIWRAPQWPAIWTGERYDVFVPDTAMTAPGARINSPAGPTSGVSQSALCQECCRDHHDNATDTPRFDPERDGATLGYGKYRRDNSNNLVDQNNLVNGQYLASCRVIRVDGFWRTASDMYQRQFGLLETTPVASVEAKSGLVTGPATSAYETFVKDYLDAYDGSQATAPGNADTIFNALTALNQPQDVDIAVPSNTDYRYLHGRGLFVDYLEADARDLIEDKFDDCPNGTPKADCVLPYLPFSSINLTEIATWTSSNPSILLVNSGNLLASNPTQPSGSRSIGRANGTADNTGTVRVSNSGVAVSGSIAGGIDPQDATTLKNDVQAFEVGGTGDPTGTGDAFNVRVAGGGTNPFVFYTVVADSGECFKPAGSDHACATNTVLGAGGLSGSIRLANYWLETTTQQSVTATCTLPNNNTVARTQTLAVPTFVNYQVATVTRNGSADGTIGAASTDNKTTESTTVTFGAIAANDLIVATLTEQNRSYATVQSCTTKNNSNEINNVVWSRPWTQP
ncbi:prepilin-type N-terminal cleavage/methylation domain-containing protein [Luteimonas pelagia]